MDSANKTPQPQGAAPDPSRIHQLADQTVHALRAAHEAVCDAGTRLEQERVQIAEDRKQLTHEQDELERKRLDCETKIDELGATAADLDKRRGEIDASIARVSTEREQIDVKRRELEALRGGLEEQRKQQAVASRALAERERAIATVEERVALEARSIEDQKLILQHREAELMGRAKQLDQEISELNAAREAIGVMQHQLTQDHEILAEQREELLQRLATAPRNAPILPARPSAVEPKGDAWNGSPKPAAANVDQFRKLRRDAKRKALGV